ncbi:MAG: glycosyltransferase [Bacteroidota bacterium]
MDKTKICHITSVHQAKDNRIFHKECLSLVKEGYDVTLLVINRETEICNGVKIISIEHKAKGRISRFLGATGKLYREAKKINADIYHFHDPELMYAGLKLKWFCGKKVIYDIHENLPASIMSKPYIHFRLVAKLISVLVGIFERFCSGRYAAIVTATPDIGKRFIKRNPIVLRNFPILPENEMIDGETEKNENAIIYVGGITKIRGIIQLINAFELTGNAELWLLGPFEDEEIQKECISLPAWSKVKYLGVVPAGEVVKYIRKAAAGIITFLPYPNHITALPTKPFEYMFGGLPMIMSDFKYWRDFFGDSALYANPSDPYDIANKINTLLSDKSLSRKMGERNLDLVIGQYNWDIEKLKLLELYKKLET